MGVHVLPQVEPPGVQCSTPAYGPGYLGRDRKRLPSDLGHEPAQSSAISRQLHPGVLVVEKKVNTHLSKLGTD